jgi:hypothetical protein
MNCVFPSNACCVLQVEGLESNLVEAGIVKATITIGLLRSHDSITQMRCVDTLHNLLSNPLCRRRVLDDGVIWALQKLVGVVVLCCCFCHFALFCRCLLLSWRRCCVAWVARRPCHRLL